MSLFDKLQRVILSAGEEWKKPEPFVKGEDFEKYLLDYTFPRSDYELVYRTNSYHDNKDHYSTASKLPDFRFICKKTGRPFYVEAKFRTHFNPIDGKLEWAKPYQLQRYKEIEAKDAPVFIAIGLGEVGFDPEYVFIIPLNKINYCGLYDSFLQRYEFYRHKPVYSSYLWKLRY